MITIQQIPVVGYPADEPTLALKGKLFIPDMDVYPAPWQSVVGTIASGFKGGSINTLNVPFTDLCNAGYLCLAHYVRVQNPLPGQTSDGKWHQQTDDLKIGIRAMRYNPFELGFDVTGKVATFGGSGSAHHAQYCAIDGVAGDDKADAAICLSPPSNLGNHDEDVPSSIQATCSDYGRTTDYGVLRDRSPVSLPNLNVASPMIQFNGDSESMPLSMLNHMNERMRKFNNRAYYPVVNTGDLGRAHSFEMWNEVKGIVIPWLLSVLPVRLVVPA